MSDHNDETNNLIDLEAKEKKLKIRLETDNFLVTNVLPTEIYDLKNEIQAKKKELEERKNQNQLLEKSINLIKTTETQIQKANRNFVCEITPNINALYAAYTNLDETVKIREKEELKRLIDNHTKQYEQMPHVINLREAEYKLLTLKEQIENCRKNIDHDQKSQEKLKKIDQIFSQIGTQYHSLELLRDEKELEKEKLQQETIANKFKAQKMMNQLESEKKLKKLTLIEMPPSPTKLTNDQFKIPSSTLKNDYVKLLTQKKLQLSMKPKTLDLLTQPVTTKTLKKIETDFNFVIPKKLKKNDKRKASVTMSQIRSVKPKEVKFDTHKILNAENSMQKNKKIKPFEKKISYERTNMDNQILSLQDNSKMMTKIDISSSQHKTKKTMKKQNKIDVLSDVLMMPGSTFNNKSETESPNDKKIAENKFKRNLFANYPEVMETYEENELAEKTSDGFYGFLNRFSTGGDDFGEQSPKAPSDENPPENDFFGGNKTNTDENDFFNSM